MKTTTDEILGEVKYIDSNIQVKDDVFKMLLYDFIKLNDLLKNHFPKHKDLKHVKCPVQITSMSESFLNHTFSIIVGYSYINIVRNSGEISCIAYIKDDVLYCDDDTILTLEKNFEEVNIFLETYYEDLLYEMKFIDKFRKSNKKRVQ